ncbi:glycosyltransferase family 9 protein [Vibrio crassostreae]|uniref:glycosyltransferase family 9 protein n=1 Tax=Vibrio crassostreae TaxID=246167 RepID=UPI00104831C8|nr:glycosyltransferase family 9 protein [Vibrio crassostreae]TCN84379.1 heptosyltransferase I [Vibrio crassostreae]TCN92830.1 heptosyltransferase I [Vibrio crassostreae]CAK1934686.1 Lipopolysaccharide core heptosyltransferase OpsX [Vibrio crassostreae]CAK1943038.1 Lipopolysaccharide core heptosyltransferase OpsX [Vibrio crassostreae]CAK1948244.1 Lipopolysaccharide core heptosyltransferase OpsX [Vibrio crassostreae]
MPLFQSAPKSLCLLRLSAIGDVCHAVAVVQSIQSHWPETRITWIVGKIEAQLIGDIPGVTVVVFDKRLGWKGVRSIWRQLAHQRFDALIHMQLALRASILTLGIKARYKVGFNRKRAKEGQWLFTNRKIPDTSSEHVLDSFFAFAEYLGVPRQKPAWYIPLSQSDLDFVTQHVTSEVPYVVISPAASKDERNWLTERYAQLVDWITTQGYQVVLCGSPSQREFELGHQIEQLSSSSPVNLIGKTTLKELTATLLNAKAVVAPDSGPAHIATTQGTPVVGLYGHSNPKRTGPYNSLECIVSVYERHAEKQHRRKASELQWSTRVKGKHIMQDISLEMVTEQLSKLLK